MTNTMFDAREALIAPGMYTNRPVRPHVDPMIDSYYRTHDRMNFFPPGPDQARNAFAANIPIPVGMFMQPMPPPAYQFNHQVCATVFAIRNVSVVLINGISEKKISPYSKTDNKTPQFQGITI